MTTIASQDDASLLAGAFCRLAAKYMVARSFATNKVKAAQGKAGVDGRWEKVAKAVCAIKIDKWSSNTAEVHALADSLGKIFSSRGEGAKADPSLLSAASKFLWFRGHHTIRIYDKRAVEALNEFQKHRAPVAGQRGWRVNGDYEAFSKAWERTFSDFEPELNCAVRELKDQLNWSLIPEKKDRNAALRVIGTKWFRDRIFDKFLWTIGKKKKRDAGNED